jgi:hypothetical protein
LTQAAPSVLEGSNGSSALQLLDGGGFELGKVVPHSLFLFASLSSIACCVLPLSLSCHSLLRLELGKLAIAFVCCLSHCCCSFLAEYCFLQIAYSLCMNIACCKLLLIDHESI